MTVAICSTPTHPTPNLTCRSGGKWMDGMKIWTNSVSMNCIFTIIKTTFYWAFTFLLDKINNIQSKAKQNEHETAEVIWCEYLFPLKPLKLMLALKQLWWYEKEKSLFCAKKNLLVSSQFKELSNRTKMWVYDACHVCSCVLYLWAHADFCILQGPQIEVEESWLGLGEEEQRALPLNAWVNIKPHYWGVIENLCTFCSI